MAIKTWINQLITTQQNQQETLVHIISILNITRYATQVNRQHVNILMNTMEKMHQDVMTLYNIMHSLYSRLSYQQIILHTMDYVDAATTGILSPDVLPGEDLREMLKHIEEMLPSTMHLPISSEYGLHFYRYLCTNILIANEQFLLLTNVPIQDHAQEMEIYEVFNLDIPHGQNKYLGITLDETSTVEISEDQFKTCKKANRQFCILNPPFYHLPTHQCVYQVCMPRTRTVSREGVPYRSRGPAALVYQHP